MKRVLVTGMSGTGKSSLLNELAARGCRTVDTDYGSHFETRGRRKTLARGPVARVADIVLGHVL